jgi:hypothetical protein
MWLHSTEEGNGNADAAQDEGTDIDSDGVGGGGREEERSLIADLPGRELWVLRLEESILLGQAGAGDDDGLAGELALVAG